jgi:hypothetical protein
MISEKSMSRLVCISLLVPSLFLAGCSLSPTAGPVADVGVAIAGKVHGGQQPVAGAHVYLFAAGTGGYGGAGLAANSANASVSLLTLGSGRTLDLGGGGTNGDYYVTTDAGGNFSISGDYACTSGQQVYLYALGGNPGLTAGTNNTAAGLLAILGSCPGAGNFGVATPYVVINEVSTVAAAYAFAGFATDAVHVGSSGTALAQVGIANAFANAGNLETLGTGVALAVTPAGNGTVPQAEINTLANILASCVNSTGAVTGPTNATGCYTLFSNAESAGASGAVPGDTATAAINIAHYPGVNVAALYGLVTAQPPFAATGYNQPNDFSVALSFTGGGISNSEAVAVDGTGNVWAANYFPSSITKLSPSGAAISPSTGYTGGGLDDVTAIAIDNLGNVWATNNVTPARVSEFSNAGAAISPLSGYPGGYVGSQIAIDGSGDAWVTNDSNPVVAKFSSSGVAETFGTGGLYASYELAIDGSGDVWVNSENNTSEISNGGILLSTSRFGGVAAGPLAIDATGAVWGLIQNGILKVSNSGTMISPSAGYSGGGLNYPQAMIIDGSGAVWIPNYYGGANGTGSLSEFSNSGLAISSSLGFGGNILNSPYPSLAADSSGNLWIANSNYRVSSATIVEFVGMAAPVVTPLAAAVKSNMLGTRP